MPVWCGKNSPSSRAKSTDSPPRGERAGIGKRGEVASRRGHCRRLSANCRFQHGQCHQEDFRPARARYQALCPHHFRRRGRAARLPRGRRARDDQGAFSALRRRALAYGMGLADAVPCASAASKRSSRTRSWTCSPARQRIVRRGPKGAPGRWSPLESIREVRQVRLRYAGTDSSLPIPWGPRAEMAARFEEAHLQRYAFSMDRR